MIAARVRRHQTAIRYRDGQDRVWSVSEVAVLKVVSPAIDGPNVALVIRFEPGGGEERLARWIGGDDWRARAALDRLFAEAESVGSVERPPPPTPVPNDTGVGPAPPETVVARQRGGGCGVLLVRARDAAYVGVADGLETLDVESRVEATADEADAEGFGRRWDG